MDEIRRLKKVIENRESTITFLNELLDGQSNTIEELKEKIKSLQDEKKELISLIESQQKKDVSLVGELASEVEYYRKENKTLKDKLSVLFNAFESIKEPSEVKAVKVSTLKEQHDKELKSPMWKRLRLKVFERYGCQCVECGSTKNIEVHHLIYRKGRHLWEYDVSELIPLCRNCHKKVSEDKNHKFHEKYMS